MNKKIKLAIAGAVAVLTIGCGTVAAGASSPPASNTNAVVWSGTSNMLTAPLKVSGLTQIGAITFATPGYWDIQVNASAVGKAYSALFVYYGPKASGQNLFNVGGALPPVGAGYLNGSMTVYVAKAAQKVYFYAGGYGAYTLTAVNVTSTEF